MTQIDVLAAWVRSETAGVVAHETVGDAVAVKIVLRALEICFQGRIRKIHGTDATDFELANTWLECARLRQPKRANQFVIRPNGLLGLRRFQFAHVRHLALRCLVNIFDVVAPLRRNRPPLGKLPENIRDRTDRLLDRIGHLQHDRLRVAGAGGGIRRIKGEALLADRIG